MSQETKKQNKKNTGKWDKSQKVGFWVLIVGLSLFWGGVYVGTQSTLSSINEREQVKVQAVEAYKAEQAELKNSEQ